MTLRGLYTVALAALLASGPNMILLSGLLFTGGFRLWSKSVVAGLLRLPKQLLVVGGFVLYLAAALVWFQVIATEV